MTAPTILIIEDNALNLKLARSILELNQYTVLAAEDAESGIEMARDAEPALILMDIQLPGMDGLTATRCLLEEPKLQDTPIVALTSYAMQGDEQKAIEAGCCGFITKPIDTRKFIEMIKTHLEPGPGDTHALPLAKGQHPARILVADDNPFNVKIMRAKLLPHHYDVITASSGAETIEKVHEHTPDLILLDVMMPEMNGFEVTRQLKSDPKTHEIPIILVTALEGTNYKVIGFEAGADDFLNKPVHTAELIKRVRSLLQLKYSRDQLCRLQPEAETRIKVNGLEPDRLPPEAMLSWVLVALDEPQDLEQALICLDDQPYKLVQVQSEKEAMTWIQKGRADVIITDTRTRLLPCFEFCRWLKGMDASKTVQCLVLTDPEQLEAVLNGTEIGIDDFLVKPINIHELRARINALIRKKQNLDRLSSKGSADLYSAMIDKSSLLYNRAYFNHRLGTEIKQAQRQGWPLAVMLLDIAPFVRAFDAEHVKRIRELAQIVRRCIREVDLPARFNEKLIGVILPNTDHQGAQIVSRRITSEMEDQTEGFGALITDPEKLVSSGIAEYPKHGIRPQDLIKRAKQSIRQPEFAVW